MARWIVCRCALREKVELIETGRKFGQKYSGCLSAKYVFADGHKIFNKTKRLDFGRLDNLRHFFAQTFGFFRRN